MMRWDFPLVRISLSVVLICTALKPLSAQTTISFARLNETVGLTNNTINDIAQDTLGFIWIGTEDGLFRYDGKEFESFRRIKGNSNTIPNNNVQSIYVDTKNNVWVLTDYGIAIYDYSNGLFNRILPSTSPDGLNYRSVTSIASAKNKFLIGTFGAGASLYQEGRFELLTSKNELNYPLESQQITAVEFMDDSLYYFGTWQDGLYRFNQSTRFCSRIPIGEKDNYRVTSIFKDAQLNLWVTTNYGLLLIEHNNKAPKFFGHEQNTNLPDDEFLSILVDEGVIWLGTRNSGLLKISLLELLTNYTSFKTEQFIKSNSSNGLSSRTVSVIFKDNDQNIWLGTHNGGIDVYNPNTENVISLSDKPSAIGKLSMTNVWGISQDKSGLIWLGTDGEGIDILDLVSRKITTFKKNNELTDKAILSLIHDRNKNLWIGTYKGGVMRYDSNGNLHDYQISGRSKDIRYIFEQMDGTILLGTNGTGVYQYRSSEDVFEQLVGTESYDVRSICEGDDISLWLGTFGNGLIKYSRSTKEVVQFNWSQKDEPFTPIIHCLFKQDNTLWLGTKYSGLVQFNITNNEFTIYDEERGLVNNTVHAIVPDGIGKLWITTNNGVSSFDIVTKTFTNFHSQSNFISNKFNDNSGIITQSRHIVLGGIAGVNIFDPSQFKSPPSIPIVKVKAFKILHENKDMTDWPARSFANEVHLDHDENFFQISFSPINYPFSTKWLVQSKLENFDKDWTDPSSNNNMIYRGIPAGKYILKLRAVDGSQVGMESKLIIIISPPWWRTYYAYFSYVIVIILIIVGLIRLNNKQIDLRQRLIYEKQLRLQEHQAIQHKLRFFTNFAHELRTPLTLIVGPITDLIRNYSHQEAVNELLILVDRNAKALKKMVNRLLEFRKVETEKITLNIGLHDINILLQEEVESFQYHANNKHVQIHLTSVQEAMGWIDIERLQIVLNNILSNALKYTREYGNIWVSQNYSNGSLNLVIQDDGIGIHKDDIKRIFSPFYQGKNSAGIGGTGIGLSLCKSLVESHAGRITAESREGEGAIFKITLPIEKSKYENRADVRFIPDQKEKDHEDFEELPLDADGGIIKNVNDQIIVVADDNPDIVNYLQSILKKEYTVISAYDGHEALRLINKYIPDLIISDIMMPKLSGVELCRILKQHDETSHIPIILLTAKEGTESIIEGYSKGADDYITKPFLSELLITRVNNLIESRKKLKLLFKNFNDPEISIEQKVSIDQNDEYKFLLKVESFILENLENEDPSVPALAHALGYSRTSLYRKIKSLTGMSINQFARSVRIKKAAELLSSSTTMTVSEIAFSLGFTDLKYFRQCFKDQFHILPSDYQRKSGI